MAKLSPSEAVAEFKAQNSEFAGVPDDGKAYLGRYTAWTGGKEFRYDHHLAWGITWRNCARGGALFPDSKSTSPATATPSPSSSPPCTFWLFLDANTGEMLEATWQTNTD